MTPIQQGDLILTENAELEVLDVRGDTVEVVDEHDDHFAQDRSMVRRNLERGTWDRFDA